MKRRYYARRRATKRKAHARFYIIIGVLILALGAGIFFIINSKGPGITDKPSASVVLTPPDVSSLPPMETATEAPSPTPTPAPSLSADLVPQAVEGVTNPSKFGFETKIMNNGLETDSYNRETPITFGSGDEYTTLEGVITFRGNNYRNAPSWGTATITEERLELVIKKETGKIGKWGGLGWTGQPLVVKWPADLRAKMTSLYDSFKNKDGFTEVIVCSLDGKIYFMELETGEKTRDPINIGAPTKGTASLDPRGYPIIYVGQGLQSDGDPNKSGNMYFRAYSLIDGAKLMEFGAATKDPFALRGWQAYDSSALIDAETDTLIVPGENGVLYTCKLNTTYDPATGAVTMDSDPVKVKYRYTTPRNQEADENGRWGMENSVATWRNYVMFTDNAGMLQCVDLNTMQLVYANDLQDDSDVSMVVEEDPVNQKVYLYTGCEYDELVRPNGSTGTAYARKLNALTGEIVWAAEFTVKSDEYVDGGILATPVLGKEGTSMAGLIIYNVTAEVKGDSTTSRLVALDKETGDEVWSYDMDVGGWSPSSPVPVYTEDGQGYIVQCDKDGDVALIKVDGQTATEVSKLPLKVMNSAGDKVAEANNFEATPVVFGNYIVVGSRTSRIFFIKIT